MPLMPFKLFKDETRLIVHNECLYKLKLTYESELSLTKAPSTQRDEVHRELTKVIRAVLFLIKTEKHIPHKIHTPCFTVHVAVKFWKIALKLGFSKNGSRLKCGHLIELTLGESRVQEKEGSKINAQVNNYNKSYLEKKAENKNLELFNHMGLRQFVVNSDDSDSESDTSCETIIICSSPEHSIPTANEYNDAVSTAIDCTTENFRISESQLNQAKSSDQTPVISDQTVQALSDSAQLLNELPHSLHSPKEATGSDQVLPVFISSCTQTDSDELDFCANNPDLNSRTFIKARIHHVQSDHDYLKSMTINHTESTVSKHAASNSNKESTHLQDEQFSNINQRSSVTNLNSSLRENEEDSSVGDDDDNITGRSCLEEVSRPAEFVKVADKLNIETLNSEPGDTFVDSLSKQSHSGHQNKNDVWGIESRQLDVVSEVEIPMESSSESSQDDNPKPLCWSKNPSKQCSKKVSEADHSEEESVENENSSNTERTKSPSQKLKCFPSKKTAKPTVKTSQMVAKNRSRIKSLRSYKKVDNIPDRKLRSSKSNKKSPKRQVFSSLEKKTPNKKTCEKRPLRSGSDKGEKRTKQENRIPEVQAEISYGLHDRYQVQTQELQEDLKLQNLSHPSSSNTNRNLRSFLEYVNFTSFLRRGKKTK